MGFGSYDESEQENQEIQTDEDEEAEVLAEDSEHDGDVEFNMEDTESAIDRLKEMRDNKE